MNIYHSVLSRTRTVGCAVLMGFVAACAPTVEQSLDDQRALHVEGEGRAHIVWISIDGLRHDYTDRADTPFFDRLMAEGAYTRELWSIFPSLTFPSHVSQATGVKVKDHGIPLNSFYDTERDRFFRFAGFADLLRAEPIWLTASRQGIRVAVHDWVMSHGQEGEVTSAYFGERYDGSLKDEERLQLLIDIFEQDDPSAEGPLQLIMGYMVQPDKTGHAYGPDAPEIANTMIETDAKLGAFAERMIKRFDEISDPGDVLYLFVTTDHGMSEVYHLVNLSILAGIGEHGDEGEEDITTITSGNVGHVFLHKLDEATRVRRADEILARAGMHDFLNAYRFEDLPEEWGYQFPTRVGDLVLVLDVGYTFSGRIDTAVRPLEADEGPRGMHGYDPRIDPNMLGMAFFWRYPEPFGGVELGRIHSLELHPTVAHLLGIEPAERATGSVIDLFKDP